MSSTDRQIERIAGYVTNHWPNERDALNRSIAWEVEVFGRTIHFKIECWSQMDNKAAQAKIKRSADPPKPDTSTGSRHRQKHREVVPA